MWIAIAALALAAPVTVESAGPVSVRVDGAWLGRMVTTATGEVGPGRRRIEVCDALGAVIGSLELEVGEDPVRLRWADDRLLPVSDAPEAEGPAPMRDTDHAALARSLAGVGRAKQLKVVTAGIADQWLTIKQLDTLLAAFDALEDQLAVARLAAPRTVDPQNVAILERRFATESARAEVRRLFAAP